MSGESHTDRGDRHPGRPQPIDGDRRSLLDTGRTQQSSAQPNPATTSGWRGGGSWLNPPSSPASDEPAPQPPNASPGFVAREQPAQTFGAGSWAPQPYGGGPRPLGRLTGAEHRTQQFAQPTAGAPLGPTARDANADPPTEVFEAAARTEDLSEASGAWRGYSADPATDAPVAGGAPPPPPPRGPRRPGGGGSEGGDGDAHRNRLAAARSWLRDSATGRRVLVAAAVVFGLALVGYIADLMVTSGTVPRGVEVAGVAIGGLDKADARAELHTVLDTRNAEAVPVKIADVQTELVPADAGLGVDWDATWDRVGGQPVNPVSRLLSFVATRKVTVASSVDEAALDRTFETLRVHDQPPVEGGIEFRDAVPVAVNPVPGRVLDLSAARTVLTDQWATASTLDLPLAVAPPAVRQEAIEQALHEIAEPAVSAPVVYTGKDDETASLNPDHIASVVRFVPDGNGGLRVEFDHKVATDLLAPQLAATEVEPEDATFTFAGAPTVVPGVVGEKIDWEKSFEQLPTMLVATGPGRTTAAIYDRVEPELTTEDAEALEITEVMGEFSTGDFSGPSGVNIRTVAQDVNGAVVQPGDTFSLNGHTGHRGTAEGYVESGIINHGRPDTAVGGGISQFATTLYNAAYFAGLEDAGHTEHSYYISRYPAAREATVYDGAIDLQFRNNTPHGLYIQAFADSSDVTVRLWGTKTVNVESITGDKSKPTEPETITLPEGDDCIASTGAPGFTISNTRVITDINTGAEISRNTRTVKYDPVPEVECIDPDKKESEDEESEDNPTTVPSSGEGRRPR